MDVGSIRHKDPDKRDYSEKENNQEIIW